MDPHLSQNAGTAAFGGILLVSGAVTWFWVGRRRFRRRNQAGIEEFSSYGGMVLARAFEKLLRFGAVLAVVSGLLVMARGVNNNMASLAAARNAGAPTSGPAKADHNTRADRKSVLKPQ